MFRDIEKVAPGSGFCLVGDRLFLVRFNRGGCPPRAVGTLLPKATSHGQGIQVVLLPPSPLFASCVVFRMMNRAKRNSEFIAHLEPETSWLGVADMMRVAG